MTHCIYCGADETSDSFSSAEHIFPKCIGGNKCLPKGWVADSVNNNLSKLELGFARENPSVAISRMFFSLTGRKHHSNRERIGIFKNSKNASEFSLGYVRAGEPIPISQVVIETAFSSEEKEVVPIRIVVPPRIDMTYKKQIQLLWEKMKDYKGSPVCIKDQRLPEHMYLLGIKENKWFLGISKKENPEIIKPKLLKLIKRISSVDTEGAWLSEGTIVNEANQVEVSFEFQVNYLDYLRVYAKIALNCLAALKGQELVLLPAFDGIKKAILTGENIEEYVWQTKGPNAVSSVLRSFPEKLSLGDRCHATAFIQKDRVLYGVVSLYGLDNPMIVKLGEVSEHIDTDYYICDWENRVDYTLIDCVLKICNHDEDTIYEPKASTP